MKLGVLLLVLLLSGCVAAPSPIQTPHGASANPTAEATGVPSAEPTVAPVDKGPTDGAMGSTQGTPGTPDFRYTVVSGDTGLQIAVRFSVEIDQLADRTGHRLGTYPELFVDDQIYFVPALVGDAYDCFYELYNDTTKLRTCRNNYDF